MTKIENQAQYEWAVKRVEELLPLVKDDTPLNDPNSSFFLIWLLIIPKNILHWENQHLWMFLNFVCTKWGLIKNHLQSWLVSAHHG